MSSDTQDYAVLLIGHGSKLDYNRQVLETQADNLRKKGYKNVYIGYNEQTQPLAGEALQEVVADGFSTVYAMPVFIANGVHLTRDVPRKLGIPENSAGGKAVIDGKEIEVRYGTAVGDDPRIADIISDRIESLQ